MDSTPTACRRLAWIALAGVLLLASPAGAAPQQEEDTEPPGLPAVPLPGEPPRSEHARHSRDPRGRRREGAVASLGHGLSARRRHPGHRAQRGKAADGPGRRARPGTTGRSARGAVQRPGGPDGRGAAPRLRREPARLPQLHAAPAGRDRHRRRRPGTSGRDGAARRGGRVRRRAVRRNHRGSPHGLRARRPAVPDRRGRLPYRPARLASAGSTHARRQAAAAAGRRHGPPTTTRSPGGRDSSRRSTRWGTATRTA